MPTGNNVIYDFKPLCHRLLGNFIIYFIFTLLRKLWIVECRFLGKILATHIEFKAKHARYPGIKFDPPPRIVFLVSEGRDCHLQVTLKKSQRESTLAKKNIYK